MYLNGNNTQENDIIPCIYLLIFLLKIENDTFLEDEVQTWVRFWHQIDKNREHYKLNW